MISESLGRAYDAFISIFSPKKALINSMRRDQFRQYSGAEQYAAAKIDRMIGDWIPINSDVNDVIGSSSERVRARVRQLVRDFPYFTRGINAICDYTVGSGITYEPRVTEPGDREILDEKTNQKIEDVLNNWFDEADISGNLHYYEMMELEKRQDVECGEFIIVKRIDKRPGRYLPFSLQLYEADWLTTEHDTAVYGTTETGKTAIQSGIEYNVSTGEILNYYFTDPNSWGSSIKIPASIVVHGFKTLRPGQRRGISPFTAGALLAHDLSQAMTAELDAFKMAAKYLAFVESPDPYQRQMGFEKDSAGKKIDSMENAIIEYLGPGESIEIVKNPRPGDTFDPFVRLILTMLSVVTGVPYEIISGDYKGLNYSVSRTTRNDFIQALKPIAFRHVRHYGMPTVQPALDMAVMSGKLTLPAYFQNKQHYYQAYWQPPGMESIDPLREFKAQAEQVNALLRSPTEIARARGRKIEDVYKEIKHCQDLAESMGLKMNAADVSTALANNPMAIKTDSDRKEIIQLWSQKNASKAQ